MKNILLYRNDWFQYKMKLIFIQRVGGVKANEIQFFPAIMAALTKGEYL